MRNGLLLALTLGLAAGSALGQAPYPGMMPGYGPTPQYAPPAYYPPPAGYAPQGGYPPQGWPPPAYPQPYPAYYQQQWSRPPVPGPYNPYPVTARSSPVSSSTTNSTSSCTTGNCPANPGPGCGCPCEPAMCPPPPAPPPDWNPTKSRDRLCGLCTAPSWLNWDKVMACFDRPPPDCQPGGYPWYGRAEALYIFMQGQSIPGSTNLGNTGGSITVPGFSPISLNSFLPNYNDIISASHLGGRFTLGRWLDCDQCWGLEATVFGTYQAPEPNYASGGPVLPAKAKQISDVASYLNISKAESAAFLTTLTGKNMVGTISFLGGAEANFRHELFRSAFGHVDLLLGFRYFDLYENMGVLNTQDIVLVQTQNLFLGGQLGVEGELTCGRLFLNGWGKFALGNNRETAYAGSAAAATGTTGSYSSFAGNEGSASRNQFAGVGETGLAVGWQLGSHTRIFASYTLLYMTNALRPESQVNNFLTGGSGMFHLNDGSFWAQGIGAGLEFRY